MVASLILRSYSNRCSASSRTRMSSSLIFTCTCLSRSLRSLIRRATYGIVYSSVTVGLAVGLILSIHSTSDCRSSE